ncbi:hypothetical protein EFV37_22080 [Mesorhizobium loti]|uniref:Uncharacterized protein n=1 Tax=Mesorhizobium jarvisii TaxID=1777867 RepID=A0A6M7TQI8_9HYPH|nr:MULTISPECIES: hypothetical protein [Mesorhizobium]QKC67149.1 hypothetical protein EB229_22075 [Mesorhizobium jarvisii]QKD13060.1 hypothetical protein EFV37_22080 [Mesorhizobium loti]RJT30757.1 hypothetical protein D3242_24710 [Mesorhizobium jarvisii]
MSDFVSQFQFLGPQDLAICQRVFDKLCVSANWERTAIEGEELAFRILVAFQHGITNEEALLAEMYALLDDQKKRVG